MKQISWDSANLKYTSDDFYVLWYLVLRNLMTSFFSAIIVWIFLYIISYRISNILFRINMNLDV